MKVTISLSITLSNSASPSIFTLSSFSFSPLSNCLLLFLASYFASSLPLFFNSLSLSLSIFSLFSNTLTLSPSLFLPHFLSSLNVRSKCRLSLFQLIKVYVFTLFKTKIDFTNVLAEYSNALLLDELVMIRFQISIQLSMLVPVLPK